MKKIIQILLIIILASILLLIAVFVFNPFNLRTKLIGGIVNSYLSGVVNNRISTEDKDGADNDTKESAETVKNTEDKHPLLNEEQEKILEKYGIDINLLPSSITPEMEACFVEKLGEEKVNEIAKGASPGAMDIFRARDCLGKY